MIFSPRSPCIYGVGVGMLQPLLDVLNRNTYLKCLGLMTPIYLIFIVCGEEVSLIIFWYLKVFEQVVSQGIVLFSDEKSDLLICFKVFYLF